MSDPEALRQPIENPEVKIEDVISKFEAFREQFGEGFGVTYVAPGEKPPPIKRGTVFANLRTSTPGERFIIRRTVPEDRTK